MLKVYEECIHSLLGDPDRNKREMNLIQALVQLCRFLDEAGYREKCVALYQSMVEFNLFCPKECSQMSFKQKLDMFEIFWDKELPRFGQANAPGWMNTLSMGNTLKSYI